MPSPTKADLHALLAESERARVTALDELVWLGAVADQAAVLEHTLSDMTNINHIENHVSCCACHVCMARAKLRRLLGEAVK